MSAARNPKGAALEQSHYESAQVVECFNDIIEPLSQDLKQRDVPFTARDLSLFIGQLQQFQQECLGAFNRPTHPPVRIPAKLFKVQKNATLQKDSAIYAILHSAYTYRLRHNWKKWDFGNPARKQKNAELVRYIRNALIKHNLIHLPKIALASNVPETQHKTIIALIKKLGAIYMDDIHEATHILYGKMHEYGTSGVEEDWFRTLEKDGTMVLVHWWYYPDSFDSWLTQTQQFADPEDPPEHSGPWKIAVRWLQDSERFNEFMNEEDYEDIDEDEHPEEVEEEEEEEEEEEVEADEEEEEEEEEEEDDDDDEEDVQHSNLTSKRKSIENDLNASNKTVKKQRTEELSPKQSPPSTTDQQEPPQPPVPVLKPGYQPIVRVRNIETEKPQNGSRQRKNEFEPYLNGDITNISQFTATNVEYPKQPNKMPDVDEMIQEGQVVSIPSLIKATPCDYSDMSLPEWYDPSIVHEIERLAIPEIGSDELSEEDYKDYRSYMITTYKENPDFYLTVSACKARLEVDLVTLIRIHSFLETSGFINVRPEPRQRIFDPYIDSDPKAQLKPKSQRNFKDIEKADIQTLRDLIYNESQVPPTRSSWDLTIQDPNDPDGRKVFNCSNCHTDCSQVRYQSLKAKEYQVCIDCFLEGRFPATFSSGDFLRVESSDGAGLTLEEAWTTTEILRLLEGVDKFDDDWLMISEHVGSRSKEQCITQFLQLPINDEFLTAQLTKQELEDLPFGDLPNPIMTTIAFLAGHINPGVGSAAAKTALKILMKSGEGQQEDMQIDEVKEDIETVKLENTDDVDMEPADKKKKIDQGVFSKELMKKATISALKSAVENARKLASYEDQEIQHWTRLAVKTMVDKLSLKVQQYDELETSLANELQEIEKQQNLLAGSIEALSNQHYSSTDGVSITATSTTTATPTTAPTTIAPTTIAPTANTTISPTTIDTENKA